jgi:hypothetical protein
MNVESYRRGAALERSSLKRRAGFPYQPRPF